MYFVVCRRPDKIFSQKSLSTSQMLADEELALSGSDLLTGKKLQEIKSFPKAIHEYCSLSLCSTANLPHY